LARSKYTPERVEKIVEAIATNGGDESGWVAGKISSTTFYDWIAKYPEFSESIERAREKFKKNAPLHQKKLAKERLTEVLEDGQTITWKTTRTRRLNHCTPNGKLKWYQEETVSETHEENRGVPQWAIDRILPKAPPDIESAIALLEQHGYIVTLPTDQIAEFVAQANAQAGEGGNGNLGLTEEAANTIRARILGVSEDASDPDALPGEMGEGHESG